MSEELKVIYLQPKCCVDPEFGRVWCEHDSPEPCPDGNRWTRYVIVPEGMALVPVEPTEAMLDAWFDADREASSPLFHNAYKAMITAYQEGK